MSIRKFLHGVLGFAAIFFFLAGIVSHYAPGWSWQMNEDDVQNVLKANHVPEEIARCMAPHLVKQISYGRFRDWSLHTSRYVGLIGEEAGLKPEDYLRTYGDEEAKRLLVRGYRRCSVN